MPEQQQIQPGPSRKVGVCLIRTIMCGFMLASGFLSLQMKAQTTVAQETRSLKDIWDGVFTKAQAARGKAVFEANCARCHGDNLEGAEEGPSLRDDAFMRGWETHTLARLYRKIRDNMPADDVNSVSSVEKLEVMTHVLHVNGFPSGTQELKADADTLNLIQIVRKGGPGPAPTGAMVQVVGCLAQGAARTWVLTNSTEPAVTTLDPQTLVEQEAVGAKPLGALTIRLLEVFPSPDPHKGHKVEAKGFLIREEKDVAVNVIVLRPLASSCQ